MTNKIYESKDTLVNKRLLSIAEEESVELANQLIKL